MSFGDVFWGRYIDDWAQASADRWAYPFGGLASFSRQEYDAWVANLECPLTDAQVSSAEQDASLAFSCPKGYASEAAKWFTAFTLANNHTDNQESSNGFTQTKDTLGANGIQYFGHYDPSQTTDLCDVVSLPARFRMADGSYKQASMPIAFCGLHHVFKLPDQAALDEISAYAKILPTWVYGHMGTEYTTQPSEIQVATYHSFIDAGADIVIGNHPHRVQTAESYKGKLIVYSLGNFIFDQLGAAEHGGYEVWRGMGLGIEIASKADASVLAWAAKAEECKTYKDDCRQSMSARENITKPEYGYKFTVVTSDNSNKGVAVKASDEWHQEVLDRLDWSNLLPKLSYPAVVQ